MKTPIQVIKKHGGKLNPRSAADRINKRSVYTFAAYAAAHDAYHDLLIHPECHRRFDLFATGDQLTVQRY